jgi:glycosyltransferase involved in cell wall biosynthesis
VRIVVATLYATIGGSSKVLLAAADVLRRNHQVVVRAPLKQADSIMRRPVSSQPLKTSGAKIRALPELTRIFFEEWRWIGRHRPEVIYVHDNPSLYVYGLIGRLLGIRVVWHVHMSARWRLIGRVHDALCDAKIHVSRVSMDEPQRKPWVLIRNPVDTASRSPRPRGPLLSIGMIGSISALKNQELAVRVLAALVKAGTQARLLVFGDTLDDAYRRQVEARIEAEGLQSAVSLRGFVPVEQALSEVDVLLACSTYESFGLAMVETLGCGISVVASDIPAHREIAAILRTKALTLAPLAPAAMAKAIVAAQSDEHAPMRVAAEFGKERFVSDLALFFPLLATASDSGDLRAGLRKS